MEEEERGPSMELVKSSQLHIIVALTDCKHVLWQGPVRELRSGSDGGGGGGGGEPAR